MEAIYNQISGLNQRLQILLKDYNQLRALTQKQSAVIKDLKIANEEQLKQLEDLKEQNLILKSSLESLSGEDKKALEKKLTDYIRSIDKCITLLS